MTISTSQPQATANKVKPRIIDLTKSIPQLVAGFESD